MATFVDLHLPPFRMKQAPYSCAAKSMPWFKKLPVLSSSSRDKHFPISVTNTAPQLDLLHGATEIHCWGWSSPCTWILGQRDTTNNQYQL